MLLFDRQGGEGSQVRDENKGRELKAWSNGVSGMFRRH
jgi:hypothetical protein